ncbi:MAG TPA: TIGR00375 family protein, partial [Acetivibrio clariflavus]|nr:TIGR00375 family protein [Acetivibrio clariflavus]
QIPLDFLPGIGTKTIDKLIKHFGSEMKILHEATFDELTKVVKEDVAKNIILARKGMLSIKEGGGGVYGKIEK